MNTFKFKSILVLIIFILINTKFLFSQITIAETTPKIVEEVVLKPKPYDSLKNWEYWEERVVDYKKYIGLKIYIPPSSNKVWDVYNDSLGDNRYFTISNVLYGDTLAKIKENLNKGRNENNWVADWVLFELRDEINNRKLLCSYALLKGFILVPYFVKMKQLYQNKYLIFTCKYKYGCGALLSDFKIIVKTEDNEGNKISIPKEVNLTQYSKWLCSDVTLLKRNQVYTAQYIKEHAWEKGVEYFNSYDIFYILKNDMGETIALNNINNLLQEDLLNEDYRDHDGCFILEKDYITRQANKKLQAQQLDAKQKQEELLQKQNEESEIAKRKTECINKFGNENGTLIADGKVAIGMNKEMCKYSWGDPLWTDKTITEQTVYEKWHYGYGYILNFIDDKLTVIKE